MSRNVATVHTLRLQGPDFLRKIAEAERALGNYINAAEYERRADEWARDLQTVRDLTSAGTGSTEQSGLPTIEPANSFMARLAAVEHKSERLQRELTRITARIHSPAVQAALESGK